MDEARKRTRQVMEKQRQYEGMTEVDEADYDRL